MQNYELTVLIHPDLESQIDTYNDRLKALVTDNGGTVQKEENWGKKRLAYSIRKQDFGVYLSYEVLLPPEAPLTISNMLNISDFSLRYLLVKLDEKERKKLEESKKRSSHADEEE